jgi:hypothetical protein
MLSRTTKQKQSTLIDSSATDNFIDFRTVAKLRLGTKKLPRARQLFNIDGTHNQAGLIEESVHLYIDRGDERIQTQLHVTNLGRDRLILGYLWLEAFNLEINWAEGKLLGPQTTLKTTGAVAQEHINEAYEIQQMAMQARKTTIAQRMKPSKPTNQKTMPRYRQNIEDTLKSSRKKKRNDSRPVAPGTTISLRKTTPPKQLMKRCTIFQRPTNWQSKNGSTRCWRKDTSNDLTLDMDMPHSWYPRKTEPSGLFKTTDQSTNIQRRTPHHSPASKTP